MKMPLPKPPCARAASIALMLLVVFVSHGKATAQLDTNFEPRTFAGSPTLARAVAQPAKEGGPVLFRNYRFDSDGVLTAIEQGTDAMGTTLEVSFESDSEGRPVRMTTVFMGNTGWIETFEYDDDGRLVEWTKTNPRANTVIESRRHVHDEDGRRIRTVSTRAGRPSEETDRTFNEAGKVVLERTTSEGKIVREEVFDYDARGCLVGTNVTMSKGRQSSRRWERGPDCQSVRETVRSFAGKTTVIETTFDDKGNPVSETTLREGATRPGVITWSYEYPAVAVPERGESEGP
ncbi:MAG: hypothetical protein ACYTDE_10145 [Planctomycetota bacterium]|jgi:YD repeat-containing protein